MQDYLGRYQDLKDEFERRRKEKTDINDDIEFETELVKQVEINIDYILMLVQKYHDSNCEDKELLVSIRKAVTSSPELRSKKELIENFIDSLNDIDDVSSGWQRFVDQEREKELNQIITEERLNESETRRFMENSFRDGEIKTTGTDIDKLMPPIFLFGNSKRAQTKQTIIDKLKEFFDRFFGIGSAFIADRTYVYDLSGEEDQMEAAEKKTGYCENK